MGTSITGFPPGVYIGSEYKGTQAQPAETDALAAYKTIAAMTGATTLTGDLGGKTLTHGVYKYASSAQLTGTLTLTGSSLDTFYFQIGSTLTTASKSSVVLVGVLPCNVFWNVGSSATLGTGTHFVGAILAKVSITATTNSTSQGGLFGLGGAVTLDTNQVTAEFCYPLKMNAVTIAGSTSTLGAVQASMTTALPTSTGAQATGTGVAASGAEGRGVGDLLVISLGLAIGLVGGWGLI